MKKYFALAAAALMLVASCKKDDSNLLPVSIAPLNGEKVYLDANNYAWWNSNDVIYINGSQKTFVGGGSSEYAIDIEDVTDINGQYYAIYPYSAVTGTFTETSTEVSLPAEQTYREDDNGRQYIDGLMAAKGTNHLEFYNICSLLKVIVPGESFVTRIVVTTLNQDKVLNGTGYVDLSGTTPVLTMHTSATTGDADKTVSLNVNAAREDGAYYVAVPQTENTAFAVTVYYRSGASYYSKTVRQRGNGNSIYANQIGVVAMGQLVIPHLLGPFSVSATQAVYFSTGNVFYVGDSTWSIESAQYDAHPYNPTGQSGFFPFSHSGNIDLGYNTLAHSLNEGNMPGNATLIDWGTRFSSIPDMAGQWGTLTSAQWTYMLNSRTVSNNQASPVGTATTGARYAFITINTGSENIHGMLIFPDQFTWPTAAGTVPATINAASTDWNSGHVYTLTEFAALQEASCCFLPAEGFMKHNQSNPVGANVEGCYWTSDQLGGNGKGIYLTFGEGGGNQGGATFSTTPTIYNNANGGIGFSVRLVYYPYSMFPGLNPNN